MTQVRQSRISCDQAARMGTPADFLLRICVSLRIPLRRWAMQELDSHARIDDADDGCPGYGEPLE